MRGTHNVVKARASASPDRLSLAGAWSKLRRAPCPTERARVANAGILRLDTLFVVGEVVVVSGSVSEEAAATAELEINGRRAPIDASGSFCANVRLAGEPALTLALETETGETITMTIPLRAGALPARVPSPQDGPPPRRLRLITARGNGLEEIPSTFKRGDTVCVTVGWLGVPQGATGEVLGVAFHDPVTCLVQFRGRTYPIPVVHLERARGAD